MAGGNQKTLLRGWRHLEFTAVSMSTVDTIGCVARVVCRFQEISVSCGSKSFAGKLLPSEVAQPAMSLP